jgi:hypothetical protein
MTIKTHSTMYTEDKTTGEFDSQPMGAYSGATRNMAGLSIHDVTNVTRKTRTISGGTKVTSIYITTDTGTISVDCFISEGE